MGRTILLYAVGLGAAAIALHWLEFRYLARAFPLETYLALVASAFVALGIWVGRRLTPRRVASGPFARNHAAVHSLGLSPREMEILEALVLGDSNKELARRLAISPNTVKTHLARVYEKLGVSRRVQAIEKARELALIP
jgi:DNA-binding CsgD family transcriptional regulator